MGCSLISLKVYIMHRRSKYYAVFSPSPHLVLWSKKKVSWLLLRRDFNAFKTRTSFFSNPRPKKQERNLFPRKKICNVWRNPTDWYVLWNGTSPHVPHLEESSWFDTYVVLCALVSQVNTFPTCWLPISISWANRIAYVFAVKFSYKKIVWNTEQIQHSLQKSYFSCLVRLVSLARFSLSVCLKKAWMKYFSSCWCH